MKKLLTILLVLMLSLMLTIACVGCDSNNNTPTCQHTTQIGTCQNCGVFQNQSNYNIIKNKLSEASNLVNIALTSISSVPNTGNDYTQRLINAIQSAQPQIDDAKNCLNTAIAVCDNYSELTTILNSLYRAKTALPTSLSNGTSIQNYLSGLRTFVTEIASARTQLAYIK